MKELKEQFTTIDEYIRTFPEEVRRELEKMKKTIQEAAPEATEAIRYQMPTFRLNGKNSCTLRRIQKSYRVLSHSLRD